MTAAAWASLIAAILSGAGSGLAAWAARNSHAAKLQATAAAANAKAARDAALRPYRP